jgi:DNA polymerase bacteriophage-type
VTSKWERTNTYGGKLAENATQAASRDILANGMIEVEAAGYPIVLSVHDEIISEVPAGSGSVEEFEGLMCRVPAWANGLPLKAKGFRARRYKK